VAHGPFPDLVSTVIPAFNAAATIDETIRSVRAQTHRNLEIIVVDDGSTDATPQVVQRHIAEDERIRLIQQPNSGVAAARNRGIREANGAYIAPIDADDLWRPEKIEKQMAALHRGAGSVGLVYTWSARIDADSRIFDQSPGARHAGMVTHEICCSNFIGNGSAVLMPKSVLEEAGGYDPSLRARLAEGVEDWLLYFRIATRHAFAVVPEHLTGYRCLPTSMSTNIPKMLKGFDLVAQEMCDRYPEWSRDILRNRLRYLTDYQYANALKARKPKSVLTAMTFALQENALRGTKRVLTITIRAAYRFVANRVWRRPKIPSDQTLTGRFNF
jgi:glycosyltransferase involved in cell wall biosynthesis